MSSVEVGGPNKAYWTQLPNIVFEIGLTAHELALYAALVRTAGWRGTRARKGHRALAAEAGMSVGMVSKVKANLAVPRDELGGKALIEIEPAKRGELERVRLVDIWPENMDRFCEEDRSRGDQGDHVVITDRSRGDQKKNLQEEPRKKNTHADAVASANGSKPPKWQPFYEAVESEFGKRTCRDSRVKGRIEYRAFVKQLAGVFGEAAGDDLDRATELLRQWMRDLRREDRRRFVKSGNAVEYAEEWAEGRRRKARQTSSTGGLFTKVDSDGNIIPASD